MSSQLSLRSAQSSFALPNLPGYRRNTPAGQNLRSSAPGTPGLPVEASAEFFADLDAFEEMSASINSYPEKGSAFNDVSGRYSIRSQRQDRVSKTRALPFSSLDSVPSFVLDDKRTCRFVAIFDEIVPANLRDPIRTRKVHISYFIEDNTLEIIEPIQANTGLMQGKIVRRHQVVKPTTDTTQNPEISIYMINDFTAGSQISIYNRIYTIIDCDSHTRKVLQEIGLNFGPSIPLPDTYYDPTRTKVIASPHKTCELFSTSAKPATNETKSFFRNNGEVVLRFFGIWDDRGTEFGVINKLRILFYANDNTMEILQDFENNDGRDRIPKLLKRSRVVKPSSYASFNDESSLSYTMEDIKDDSVVYTWTDFRIGGYISSIGIEIQITDADHFTRHFYERNGITLGKAIQFTNPPPTQVEKSVPPYNGFGSEEDSLMGCTGRLVASPVRKARGNAKQYQGQVLRFKARILNARGADKKREFVVQVHLEDDTIQIREPPVPNSGFKGGRFLSREKVKRADGSIVKPRDVMVGSVISVHSCDFLLEECDDFSLKYMQTHPELWPECNLPHILRKLRAQQFDVARIVLMSPGNPSRDASYADLERMLQMRAGVTLTPQELATLTQGLDPERKGTIKFSKLVAMIEDTDMLA